MLSRRGWFAVIPVLQQRGGSGKRHSCAMLHSISKWKGLDAWRSSPVDERRLWGKHAPAIQSGPLQLGGGIEFLAVEEEQERGVKAGGGGSGLHVTDLARWGALVLLTTDPLEKARLTHQAFHRWTNGELEVGIATAPDAPGRPSKPDLVPPRQVPSPKDSDLSPSAHMMHNLAHIELNAIDLAWDTVVRFSYASDELGRGFFGDFLHVADDESRHFRWCSQRLNELGFSYGDMPAHNLLWKDCMRTSGSVKSRLAVIPMMQEARGLDAGPRLVKRLLGLDDHRSAEIVRRIGQEEVAHVGVGVFHFLRVCEKLGVIPGDEFKEVMVECNIELHGPFNHQARAMAGFERDWYDRTESSGEEGNTSPANVIKKDSVKLARNGEGKVQQADVDSFKKCTKHLQVISKVDESSKAVVHSAMDKESGDHIPEWKNCENSSSYLPEVFERLAVLVAMEKDNAGT